MPPVQFAIQSYQSRALPLSAQRLVNYFAEAAPKDAKSPVVLLNCPGIKSFADSVGNGPIRGAHDFDGTLFVVSGNTLYEVASTGLATSRGTINTSSGPVSMSHNQASTKELCIVDGADGWIYSGTTLARITDTDFFASSIVGFMDQYFLFIRDGSGQFFISNLNAGTVYTATDIANAEGDPDNLVAFIINHREVWLMGKKTIEVWYDSGASDFPFTRFEGGFLERGCAAAFSVAEDDNTIFWLAEDRIVYRAVGYTPERISQHGVEEAWRTYGTISDAEAFIYTMGGHKFYVLTFPAEDATWVYDINTGLWHERQSFGLGRWRVSTHVDIYGKHLVGDFQRGRIGELDLDTYDEWGGVIQGIAQGPPAHSDRKMISFRRFEVDVESGVGLTSGQGSDPQIQLDWSDDGARTWSARKLYRSMGKIGAYQQRLRWNRMGSARNRVYRLTVTDKVKRSIIGVHLNAKQGRA